MWVLISLKCENLFSHEKSEVNFINNETTMVCGVNKTDPNVISNRAGKTSVLDIISLALIGEPLRDIKKGEIIRNGQKSGNLELLLRNDVLKQDMLISRTFDKTKSNTAQVLINNEPVLSVKDLSQAVIDKEIISILGISKEDLRNYYLISKDSYQSFFTSGDVAKKEIINRFSKADVLDNSDDVFKKDISDIDVKINQSSNQIQVNNSILTHTIGELDKEKLESSIEKSKQLIIDSLQSEVDKLNKDLLSIPTKVDELTKLNLEKANLLQCVEIEIISLNDELMLKEEASGKLDSDFSLIKERETLIENKYEDQLNSIKLEINQINSEINEYNQSVSESLNNKNKLKNQLEDHIDCPKCSHKFSIRNKEFDYENILELIKGEEEFIASVNELINEANNNNLIAAKKRDDVKELLKNELLELKESKNTIQSSNLKIRDEISKLKLEIRKVENERSVANSEFLKTNQSIDDLKNRLTTLGNQIEIKQKAIIDETNKVYPSKIQTLEESIKQLEEKQEKLQHTLDELSESKSVLLEWQVRFKQFKSFLANTSITSIEDMINFYLGKMKTNLSVKINGFRELTNGKMKEEIETLVSRDGLEEERINKFSGEEKCEINLATILSFQKLINMTSESGGLNFLFIDEILESADNKALENIIKSISKLNQTILLITFIGVDSVFDCNSLVIEKVNGISKIMQ